MSDLKFHPDALVLSWPSLDLDPAYNLCSGLDPTIFHWLATDPIYTVQGVTIKVKKPVHGRKVEFENGSGI